MNLCAEDTPAGVELGREAPRAAARDAFEQAVDEMESAILASCDAQQEWPARISAAVEAATGFAIANPTAVRTLAIDSRAAGPHGNSIYPALVQRFAALLGAGAPRSERLPASSDEAVVWVIAAIFSCHVRAGTVDSLRDGDPDLVFLALLPYVGFAEACRWSTIGPDRERGKTPQV